MFASNNDDFDPTNFFKIYFDFAYYLCICPFRVSTRLTKNGEKTFQLQTWLPQKLFCGLNSFLCLFCMLTEIRQGVPSTPNNPSQYFVFFSQILSGISKSLIMKVFWYECGNIVPEVLEKLENFKAFPKYRVEASSGKLVSTKRSNNHQHPLVNLIWRKWTLRIMCMIAVILAIFHGMRTFTLNIPLNSEHSVLESYWNQLEHLSCYNFFLTRQSHGNGTCSDFDNVPKLVIVIPAILGLYQRHMLRTFAPLLLLMCCLTLWLTVKESLKMIQEQVGTPSWNRIQAVLEYLEMLSKHINTIIGGYVFIMLLEMVVVFSTRMHEAFVGEGDIIKMIRISIFFFTTNFILMICADISRQMHRFKRQIKLAVKSLAGVDNALLAEVQMTLSDLEENLVAIRAADIFPITYSVLANVSVLN